VEIVWLLLAVAMSSSIAVAFRVTERANLDRYAVTAANYVVACAVAGVVLARADAPFAPAALRWAVPVGLAAGVVFFLSFVLYQVGVRRHGVALAGAAAKLGVVVPAAASLALFAERPSPAQWAGLAAALLAVPLLARPTRGGSPLHPALLCLLVLSGLAEFSNKIYEWRGALEHRALFLLAVFGTAFLCAATAAAVRRRPVTWREALAGVAVGVPNFFSSYFLIRALAGLPAAAVFPAFGAGTIVVLSLVGALAFGERIGRREAAVLVLAAAGVALLGL
jgi:drug/metabolite transporter (DMT)-like permease